MSLAILIVGIALFLVGAIAGVLAVFVIGIHMSRGSRLTDAPQTRAGAASHRFLIGVRDCDDDQDHGK
jgi:hypothetical protein